MPQTTMHNMSVSEISAALHDREFTCLEVVSAFIERVRALDSELNSFITITEESALNQARAADRCIQAGDAGPLTGIPVAHKDIFCTRGVKTSCGSRMLDNFIAPYDATVVERMYRAGMVMLGKTNMDEFAMGSSNENSFYGPVHNPWDLGRVPGGSSGGSAAAVAARVTPVATGTDTGGSVRQPAALCGVTGLKPTYGRVSRYGMVAFASSLDQGGAIARTARDLAFVLAAMAGFDERDSTSANRPVDNYVEHLDKRIESLKIGLPKEHFGKGLHAGVAELVDAAIRQFEQLGATVHEISLANSQLSVPTYYVIAPSECSSNLSRFDGVRYGYRASDPHSIEDLYKRSRKEGFGAEVKRRLMIGTYALSTGYYDAYYLKAQRLRQLISRDFREAFSKVDVIMGPTSPTVAFRLGERVDDPVTMYLSDIYTVGSSLAGLPAISIPVGFSRNLPVGLQIIGNYFAEGQLLRIAHQYQCATDWHARTPEICQ